MEDRLTQKPNLANVGFSSESRSSFPSLEPVAMVVLEAGKMLMEARASAKSVEGMAQRVGRGLGAEQVDVPPRSGQK